MNLKAGKFLLSRINMPKVYVMHVFITCYISALTCEFAGYECIDTNTGCPDGSSTRGHLVCESADTICCVEDGMYLQILLTSYSCGDLSMKKLRGI